MVFRRGGGRSLSVPPATVIVEHHGRPRRRFRPAGIEPRRLEPLVPFALRYRGRIAAALARPRGRLGGDARRARRRAPRDRSRLLARGARADRRLFRHADRRRRRSSRWRARFATTSSSPSASGSSPTCAPPSSGISTALDPAFFDAARSGRDRLAAHRRHDAGEIRLRGQRLDRPAQPLPVPRRRRR